MNQVLKDLWKKNFPSWPDVLIEKFADQIEIEANYFDSNFGFKQKEFYNTSLKNVNRTFKKTLNMFSDTYQVGSISLFNPQNPKFYVSNSWGPAKQIIYSSIAPVDAVGTEFKYSVGDLPMKNITFEMKSQWDSRLFENFIAKFSIIPIAIDSPYIYYQTFVPIKVFPVENVLEFILLNPIKNYAQSDSLLALHENGVDMPGVDYAKMYEFNIYLKAYQNYSAQIQGAENVAKKTAAADILNYKSDLDSKLLAQKNNLQNLTLHLTSQTAAEAASAKRDMQQLSLQVATIKLQIMGLVK